MDSTFPEAKFCLLACSRHEHPVSRQFQRHEAAADLKTWWTSDEPGARNSWARFTSALLLTTAKPES